MATPRELEISEFGVDYRIIRNYSLRIIHIPATDDTTKCLFLFHGGGGRACQFKHQIREFKYKVDIVAVDFLGHGESPSPNEPHLYTADEHLACVYEIFNQYKKSSNFIVAHCYGSIHTLRLMHRLREEGSHECVKGIVVISLGVTPPIGGIGSWLVSIPATIQEWLRPLARSSSNAKIFSPHSDPQLILFENSLSDNNRMYVMRVIGSDCCDIVRWSQWLDEGREGIGNDGIIFALIAGEDDGMFSVEDCRQLFNSISPQNSNMFHVIKGTGHLSMMEKSESINAIIRDVIYSD